MGQPERDIIRERLLGLKPWERLFRANAGTAWTGEHVRITRAMSVQVRPGDMLLRCARPFRGMPEGFPDLVGWESVEITPDMVGQRVAVFTAEEVKATGRLSRAQRRFRDVIEKMGGVFRVIT